MVEHYQPTNDELRAEMQALMVDRDAQAEQIISITAERDALQHITRMLQNGCLVTNVVDLDRRRDQSDGLWFVRRRTEMVRPLTIAETAAWRAIPKEARDPS